MGMAATCVIKDTRLSLSGDTRLSLSAHLGGVFKLADNATCAAVGTHGVLEIRNSRSDFLRIGNCAVGMHGHGQDAD